jgi:transposase
MCRPENWTKEQRQALVQRGQVQEIELGMELVDHFLTMLRPLQGEQLEDWMQAAQQSNIREMQNVVEKLRKDQQAVQAGLTLTWNNGVVEGHVNRLNCLKRMMDGRALFDLLPQRVLYRSSSPPSPTLTQPFHAKCG